MPTAYRSKAPQVPSFESYDSSLSSKLCSIKVSPGWPLPDLWVPLGAGTTVGFEVGAPRHRVRAVAPRGDGGARIAGRVDLALDARSRGTA